MEKAPSKGRSATIEYENMEALAPVYAEGAQGMVTPKDSLHVSFYSEYLRPKSPLKPGFPNIDQRGENTSTVHFKVPDPFGLDQGNITIVRRIETSIVVTKPFLIQLIPWLQARLDEIRLRDKQTEVAVTE